MSRSRILLAISALLAATACNEEKPKVAEVRPVRTLVVDVRPVEDARRAVGEIRPRHESDLGFRVAGKVLARKADVGVTVKKGDLLARLDDQDHRNRLKSAQADIVAARAVLVEAQAAESRLQQLLASGATTRANHDVAQRNLRSAEAKLDAAQAAFDLAQDQLAYSELHAEFDGIVTAVGADMGQVVTVGQMIVRLARPDEKDAVFAIAEAALEEAQLAVGHRQMTVTLLSNPGLGAEGVVREVSPAADPATRTHQVKVTLANPPEQMRFGNSVAGRLRITAEPVVVLPGSALYDKAGKPAVWVVDPADGSVVLKAVSVARYETDRVIVSEGLVKGEIVVTAGVNRLREKQKVRLIEEASR